MNYPTMEQVESADHIQLARWCRFLSSPGAIAIGCANFSEILEEQKTALDRIIIRFNEFGGWNSELSKHVG